MIPAAFFENVRAQLGNDAEAFLAALQDTPVRGIRLNPRYALKPPEDAGRPVPWYPGMYELSMDSDAGKSICHEGGGCYLQEPSAAAPAAVMAPKPGELILDLCAAPGGKTTAMAALAPEAFFVANEIHPERARILSSNVERLGCAHVAVFQETPQRLAEQWTVRFDGVLVDAPCSGEGMFRRHPETADEWTPEAPAACARRQSVILDDAARMVRPGGRLCYSTCTFNRLENEDQVAAFLERHPDFEPALFELPGVGTSAGGCIRLWPHRLRGEGHFVALLRRRGDAPARREPNPLPRKAADQSLLEEAGRMLKELTDERLKADLAFGGGVWQQLENIPKYDRLKCLRPGLRLFQQRGSTLIPDHALSRACRARQTRNLDNVQAARYIHGETLEVPETLRGWTQVWSDGVPLGWGKATQGVLKNHYPKGLRK